MHPFVVPSISSPPHPLALVVVAVVDRRNRSDSGQ